MRQKKTLAFLMLLIMAITLVPSTVFATPETFPVEGVVINGAHGNGTLWARTDVDDIVAPHEHVEKGKDVKFEATPEEGYQVKEWTVNGSVVPNNTSNGFTLTNLQAATKVTVEFEKSATTFPVDIAVINGAYGNGTLRARTDVDDFVTPNEHVEKGKDIKFEASPNEGYQVKEWTVDGKVVPNNTSNGFTLTNLRAATKITVEFEKKHGNHDKDWDKDRNRDKDKNKNKVEQTIFVNVLWHDNDYGDWKNYRPAYLVFTLEAYDKEGGWTQGITCNVASYGFRWQANWSFTEKTMVPQRYADNSAYTLSGPVNPPTGYTFTIVQNSKTTWTVTAKLDPTKVKTMATSTPKVPMSGF